MIAQAEALGTSLPSPKDRDQIHRLVTELAGHLDPDEYVHQAGDRLRLLDPLLDRLVHQMLREANDLGWEPGKATHEPYAVTFDETGLYGGVPDHAVGTGFLESLRQQLTQGWGLRCPLWQPERSCCGRRFLLERLWERTQPAPGCPHWEREGCLGVTTRST
jgi:hypothetical protein